MRIISGTYKNKEILSPKSDLTHPMGSRERIALFNMLLPYLPPKTVLDAFSGSGALGLESLSRGAENVVFVDKDHKSCEIIHKNLENLGTDAKNRSKVFRVDVSELTNPEKNLYIPTSFDLIFADPPYDKFDIKQILPLVKLLNREGVLVVSSPIPLEIPGLSLLKSRKYASCIISLFVL